VAAHYLRLEDFPKNKVFYLLVKRLLQDDPDAFCRGEKLLQDEYGNIRVKGFYTARYGLQPVGYLPGEKVHYRVVLEDETLISEGTYIPRPIVQKSEKGTFTLEAQLLSLDPVNYKLILTGLEEKEEAYVTAVSQREVIERPFKYNSKHPLAYTANAKGVDGGKAYVQITRRSGDTAMVTLLWGSAIWDPLFAEANDGREHKEFSGYVPILAETATSLLGR